MFAKKGKFEADEIPAATQIFTPNWIVKYMVQNTVGRIYLDNNPYETQLQKKWQYLVEPSEKTDEKNTLKYNELTDLKVADLACGSGHILNECFDLLYDLYIAEGYGRGEAVENIFSYNLTGIDLDTRAKQLSQFALLLKACQKDAAFADAHCMPNVLTMPVCDSYTIKDTLGHFVCAYQLDWANVDRKELEYAFDLMKDADSLGSIMRFEISQNTREHLIEAVNAYDAEPKYTEAFKNLIDGFRLILSLTENYHALVMNPPYMGSGNMNGVLSKYVKDNYKNGKADLATVFVEMMGQRTSANGSYAFIIPPSWMFLSTFEGLRKNIIENQSIESLLHLSRGVFGADFGASSAVIKKTSNANASGTYFRLVERTFQEFEQSHLRMLFEQTLSDHDFKYDFKEYTKDVTELPYSEDGNRIYYPNVEQMNFEKIPGCPIGYWVSKNLINLFTNDLKVSDICKPASGLSTTDDQRFLRLWHEISEQKSCLFEKYDEHCENHKWVPITKGGGFRKWYGNMEFVVNWQNNGYSLRNESNAVLRNSALYFTSCGYSWCEVATGKPSFRYVSPYWLFNNKGPVCIPNDRKENNILFGFLNSVVAVKCLELLAPTISFNSGAIGALPYKKSVDFKNVSTTVQQNIAISKSDWDAHETSWDFQHNELLSIDTSTYTENIDYKIEKHFEETGEHISLSLDAPQLGSLEWRMEQYKTKWERKFMQLHKNEEELNRQFINIYGLQDELTPDVPLNEITILQQGEISIE